VEQASIVAPVVTTSSISSAAPSTGPATEIRGGLARRCALVRPR
jgi:hypothetical protein